MAASDPSNMADSYDLYAKVYSTGDTLHSIADILSSATLAEHMHDGMPRISDFHFKVGEPVRFRYDSALEVLSGGVPLTEEVIQQLLFPLLSPAQRKRFADDILYDVDAGFTLPGTEFNFRINAFRDQDGSAFVVRFLSSSIPSIDRIGFPSTEIADELVALRQGLVLVTGITGSGKSTTIASLIQQINRQRKVRIITLEDPIEYRYTSDQSLISQRELDLHIPTFSAGLKSALREDPDIIVVGEMRDPETTALALTAAETGHLVFSTLHTPSASGTITRILEMFPPERLNELAVQMSISLNCVICQKLVPRISGEGRVVAMEILRNTPAVAHIIRSGKVHQLPSLIETKAREGMISMEQSLADLYASGVISREDAIAYARTDSIKSLL